jgi:predicted HicB family RNase H-like nuclease
MSREPMKAKAVRVPNDLWKAAQTKADERGEYLSEVIRKALERYVSRK